LRDILVEYINWRRQLELALRNSRTSNPTRLGSVDGIVFTGMGGSGIVGDVLAEYLKEATELPVAVVKSYRLPRYVRRGWLAVAISYSGNTLETLNAAREALRRGSSVAVIASGGRLLELAKELRLPYVAVEPGLLPRVAFPSLLVGASVLLRDLLDLGLELSGGLRVLEDLEGVLKLSERLAAFLKGGIPVFVATEELYPLALRAKNEFNENAKVVCKVEVVPEWGHNDIVGWEGVSGVFKVVVFRYGSNELTDFAARYIARLGHEVEVVDVSRGGYIESILYGSWLVGLASVILGRSLGVDPSETRSIGVYKEFLAKVLPP
jgi:glucose/mannose-6-phosphate isomerase